MNRFVELPLERRVLAFEQASNTLGLPPVAIEKDFWVVWVLERLFSSPLLAPKLLFKGGTSLSKVFRLVDRFSEDIDLILDWNEVLREDPMAERSKTKQDQFNKSAQQCSQAYIANTLLPEIQHLVGGLCEAQIEKASPDVINIGYPSKFTSEYLRPEIRLEIGPLAQWIPNASYEITSYVSEALPQLFEKPACSVNTIKAERTFWEKATILHHEAHRPEGSIIPARYSRHYYDLFRMANAPVKSLALADLDLLDRVVEFKMRFYPRGWARVDLAKPGTLKLIPPARILNAIREDYEAMRDMMFGDIPSFDQIVAGLTELEAEINTLGPQGHI